ncbi:hypothetical protein ACTFIR_012050 [Dictyostelium discoideum]
MSTIKKIKTNNNSKIFQDIIDFEILKSIFNYLLIISKKWYNFISLTISNNIINNKSFEYWLKINNKSFIENYNNQNQYDKNNLIFKNQDYYQQNEISFNKEFSIIKIKESIINDYFKFNLFLNNITINDFKEIKNKFENNQLLYNRIVVNVDADADYVRYNKTTLFEIHEYISNESSEIISNLFKILQLNIDFCLDNGYSPNSEEEEEEEGGNKKCTEIYLNNLSITGFDGDVGNDEETVKIFKIFKGKNIYYDGSDACSDMPTHVNYSALFDPDNSGQQVESIKVEIEPDNDEFVEPLHLAKVNQFENLHSITIPFNSFQILSNLSEDMGFIRIYNSKSDPGNSENMKSELNQMINSFITCKSLKNLNISSVSSTNSPIDYDGNRNGGDHKTFANKINETIESYSNSFQPLFSELNTSIERIEFDCCGLLNINTFSNLLNNKSIKYLYLYGDSDFIVYSSKPIDNVRGRGSSELHLEPISINQYLFDNIFSSPLTSIRHYKIRFKELNQLKFIFNLILNNIFKLQLYSLIFKIYKNELVCEFVEEYKNLINNISIQQQQQQQQQQQKSNNITLKEIKIETNDNEYIQGINNIKNPYFITVIKKN